MKKLKLNKLKSIGLNNSELATVTGGGKERSNRRTGNCSFSKRHIVLDGCGDTIGCRVKPTFGVSSPDSSLSSSFTLVEINSN
jgi:hypothetical protein